MGLFTYRARVKKREARSAGAKVPASRCTKCPAEPTIGRFCRKHWFSNAALNSTGKWRDGPALEHLFVQQQALCAYTGMPLVPGESASLDHRIPLSRSGDASIDNLQWVTYQVNRMKNDMTHDEFLAMCSLVLEHEDWKRRSYL